MTEIKEKEEVQYTPGYIQKKVPSRFMTIPRGWYDFDELAEVTGLSRKGANRIALRCHLKTKQFRGIDRLGRPRRDMIMVFWPGPDEYLKQIKEYIDGINRRKKEEKCRVISDNLGINVSCELPDIALDSLMAIGKSP